jgi:hypothetical protein
MTHPIQDRAIARVSDDAPNPSLSCSGKLGDVGRILGPFKVADGIFLAALQRRAVQAAKASRAQVESRNGCARSPSDVREVYGFLVVAAETAHGAAKRMVIKVQKIVQPIGCPDGPDE